MESYPLFLATVEGVDDVLVYQSKDCGIKVSMDFSGTYLKCTSRYDDAFTNLRPAKVVDKDAMVIDTNGNGEWTQLEFDFTPPAEPELCESCDTDTNEGCDCHECGSCGRLVSETYQGICQGCEDGQTINGLRFQ